VLLVVTVVFFVFRIVPGDPAVIFASPDATTAEIQAVRHSMGLDQPILIQYGRFLTDLTRGNLGVSTSFGIPVTAVLGPRIPNTVLLALASLAVAVVSGVTCGMYVALRPRAPLSQLATVGVIGLLAIPNFWLGLLLMQFFGVRLRWLPVAGTGGLSASGAVYLVMPIIALSGRLVATIMRTAKASVAETLAEEYIRTAYAKGLAAGRVIWRHALRPSLVPIITVVGLQMGNLLGGATVIEILFNYQGIGLALIKAVGVRDYALVQGIMLSYACFFLVVNLGVDVSYAYFDPRIRYQ